MESTRLEALERRVEELEKKVEELTTIDPERISNLLLESLKSPKVKKRTEEIKVTYTCESTV